MHAHVRFVQEAAGRSQRRRQQPLSIKLQDLTKHGSRVPLLQSSIAAPEEDDFSQDTAPEQLRQALRIYNSYDHDRDRQDHTTVSHTQPTPAAMGPQAPDSFFLTNGANQPPLVHGIFNPTTKTWQYVVADPTGDKCVVIDPMLDQSDHVSNAGTTSADQLLDFVQQHNYRVTHILETHSTAQPIRSASWALRMQLLRLQSFAPEMCSSDTVEMMHKKYARRHGNQSSFSTTLAPEYTDGQRLRVGRMRVKVLQIPGPYTPNRRAYVIDGNVFGAHSIADLKPEDVVSATRGVSMSIAEDEGYCQLHRSMQKVLSLPGTTRVYNEEGDERCATFTPPFTTIEECRTNNEYADLSARQLAQRRNGERSLAIEKSRADNKVGKRSWGFKKSGAAVL